MSNWSWTPPASRETSTATTRPEAQPAASTLDKEAAEYVANLAKPDPEPIQGESADHFIGADQEIRFGPAPEDPLPGSTGEIAVAVTPDDPLRVGFAEVDNPTRDTGTPKTARENGAAVAVTEPVEGLAQSTSEPTAGAETATAKQDEAAAAATGPIKNPDEDAARTAPIPDATTAAAEPVRNPDVDTTRAAPVPDAATAAEDEAAAVSAELLKKPDDDISDLVSNTRPANKPAEDAAGSIPSAEAAPFGEGEAIRARARAFRGTGETPTPQGTITIRELLEGTVEVGEHDVFYVHAVTPDDYQGLWGIIQRGVTENFARGVRITHGVRTDTYRIAVPRDADELLEDRSSSPLGLMIHRKSGETIIYNREIGRLTQDPDVTLYPGNEIIIVGFKPEELISLYKHFAGTDGG